MAAWTRTPPIEEATQSPTTGDTAPSQASQAALRARLAQEIATDESSEDLLARWDRWGNDLLDAVETIYPGTDVNTQLVDLIAAGHLARSTRLRELDRVRILRPDWFQDPQAIGYAAYAQRFGGNLRAVGDRIDYLRELGVTYLHLMPLLQPRPGPNDGGYAVMDYDRIRPDVGTMEDLSDLTERLHAAGISLALDLVLNHVAYEHRWAQAAREGDERYRSYFWTFPDRSLPDEYEQSLPEVFPHTAPGNFTWDEQMQRWVWTTFNTWQWDLNWSNPDVLAEFARIVLNLANRGVDCLRLDAIAFLWKRTGTNCQNQTEVHAITQILRAVARIVAPAMIFKAEAIVGPNDLTAYLGTGDRAGKVSDMAYHNSLMVQIWSALATRDARLLDVAISRIPDLPTTAAWSTYLRCHDDIGWAIDDTDAAQVGWNGPLHRDFLSDFYTGRHEASFAEGLVFQENPFTGDRRVSGTAASLSGIGCAEDEPQLDIAVDRMLMAYAMVLGFGGLPILYMGDEWALLNDHSYIDEPEHADDTRWVHRPNMPWEQIELLRDADGPARRVYDGLRHLISLRKRTRSLHASVPTRTQMTSVNSVICLVRKHPAGDVLQIYNVADHEVEIPAAELDALAAGTWDLITGTTVVPVDGKYRLPAYAKLWLCEPPSAARFES